MKPCLRRAGVGGDSSLRSPSRCRSVRSVSSITAFSPSQYGGASAPVRRARRIRVCRMGERQQQHSSSTIDSVRGLSGRDRPRRRSLFRDSAERADRSRPALLRPELGKLSPSSPGRTACRRASRQAESASSPTKSAASMKYPAERTVGCRPDRCRRVPDAARPRRRSFQ